MAENGGGGSSSVGVVAIFLIFVIVVVLAFLTYRAGMFGGKKTQINVNVSVPSGSQSKPAGSP